MNFKPKHINATFRDFKGNNGINRYVFLPGSNDRARQIASYFDETTINKHPTGHNIYKGVISYKGKKIDVASVSSGMGTPSLDIIVNELNQLGVKRYLRVGTAGLLQPKYMEAGDFVIGTGAIRDDGASANYLPPEFPAIASMDMVFAAQRAAKLLKLFRTHTGLIHSKDSLWAREFKMGPLARNNGSYMQVLKNAGALASEMEASMLFILAEIFNHYLQRNGRSNDPVNNVKAGVICVVLGEASDYGTTKMLKSATKKLIKLCIQTVKELAIDEML